MLLEKIKEKYGKDLPGKSQFRNDPEAPCLIGDISEEFGSWDKFVVEYNKPSKEPVKAEKKVGNTGKEVNDPKTKA